MPKLTPEIVGAIVRHIVGGLAVKYGLDGYLDGATLDAAAGAIALLAVIGWSIWQKHRAAGAAPTKAGGAVSCHAAVLLPLLLLAALPLGGCAGGRDGAELTPRQQAYDLLGKTEAAMAVIEQAVKAPDTPDGVKRYLKLGAQGLTEAARAYRDAVAAGGEQAVVQAAAALANALANMSDYLFRHGFIRESRIVAPPAPVVFVVQLPQKELRR